MAKPNSNGTTAWLAWFTLHLITLLDGRNRITALRIMPLARKPVAKLA